MVLELILGIISDLLSNWVTIGLLLVVLYTIYSGAFVCNQWENMAVLRFGTIIRVVDNGLHFKIPYLDSTITVDLRTEKLDLSKQTTITKDNISVGVDAVVFVKISDIEKSILYIVDFEESVVRASQTCLRDMIGNYTLDDLLEHRDEIAAKLKENIEKTVGQWGAEIVRVGLQDISLPEDMQRAFAVQGEAERESRAIQIKAQAELTASKLLKQAAANMTDPNAMQLRILQTVNDISKDQSNTIILALPTDTLRGMDVGDVGALSSIGSSHAKLKSKKQ